MSLFAVRNTLMSPDGLDGFHRWRGGELVFSSFNFNILGGMPATHFASELLHLLPLPELPSG